MARNFYKRLIKHKFNLESCIKEICQESEMKACIDKINKENEIKEGEMIIKIPDIAVTTEEAFKNLKNYMNKH